MGETKKGSERPPKKGTHAAEAGDRGRRQEAHVVEHGLVGAPGEAVGGGVMTSSRTRSRRAQGGDWRAREGIGASYGSHSTDWSVVQRAGLMSLLLAEPLAHHLASA